jgi:hypothetical protein
VHAQHIEHAFTLNISKLSHFSKKVIHTKVRELIRITLRYLSKENAKISKSSDYATLHM